MLCKFVLPARTFVSTKRQKNFNLFKIYNHEKAHPHNPDQCSFKFCEQPLRITSTFIAG